MTDSLTASSTSQIKDAAEFLKQWRILTWMDGRA